MKNTIILTTVLLITLICAVARASHMPVDLGSLPARHRAYYRPDQMGSTRVYAAPADAPTSSSSTTSSTTSTITASPDDENNARERAAVMARIDELIFEHHRYVVGNILEYGITIESASLDQLCNQIRTAILQMGAPVTGEMLRKYLKYFDPKTLNHVLNKLSRDELSKLLTEPESIITMAIRNNMSDLIQVLRERGADLIGRTGTSTSTNTSTTPSQSHSSAVLPVVVTAETAAAADAPSSSCYRVVPSDDRIGLFFDGPYATYIRDGRS